MSVAASPLMSRIKSLRKSMTRSELKIANHLMRHVLDAAFMPAAKLAELVDVSESSVLRFSKALGYPNYQVMQQEIQDGVRQRLTQNAPERLQQAVDRESGSLSLVLETDIGNLRSTLQQVENTEFQAVVELLCSAPKVKIIGMRGAAALAELLAYSLNLLRPGISTIAHHADIMGAQLIDLTPADLVLGFAFSRQSLHTVNALETARQAKVHVVAITDDPLSPIGLRADHSLIVATESEAFIQSYTAACAVIHALISAVGMALHSTAMARLEAIELVLDANQVFYQEQE